MADARRYRCQQSVLIGEIADLQAAFTMQSSPVFDLLVIGGGINGTGIARDAAGRGLSVFLAEKGDLAGATSSASSKLIHGGLRYLEYYAFRLVREALAERDVLLRNAPHIIWPMRFVLPHSPEQRPIWMIRAGLWLYDHLGWNPGTRSKLPGSHRVDLRDRKYVGVLRPDCTTGFIYSDCWVDDARMVVLNARDAAGRGAAIRVRTAVTAARRVDGLWRAEVSAADGTRTEVAARALVNAAGPWVRDVLGGALGFNTSPGVRLVKGSHIVVPRLYEGEHAFILQNDDRRIVFVIPYEGRFTLIGTTDIPFDADPATVAISPDETAYLCRAVSRYFARPVAPADVVWSYAGVRPLYDDGSKSASEVTRDYVLDLQAPAGQPPLLSVFGGKITTYRRLAEHALEKLAPHFPAAKGPWTATAPLPGGDIPDADFERYLVDRARAYPWLPGPTLHALARRHGTWMERILHGARALNDLGQDFGAGLYAREIDHFVGEEWARTADDVLLRRTKLALHIGATGRRAVADYLSGSAQAITA
jgi:glycerol-3-phosphate dehydrogenase